MNKKTLTRLVLVLTVCITFIIPTGCDRSEDEDTPKLSISIINDSASTLKHIYWMSDVSSGVLDIDVPKNTQQETIVDIWPGEIFQLMITTSDTDKYVKWIDVEPSESDNNMYLIGLVFNVKILDSCLLNASFGYLNGLSLSSAYSFENKLPSI